MVAGGVGERRPAAAGFGLGRNESGGDEEEEERGGLFCFGVWVWFRLPWVGFGFHFRLSLNKIPFQQSAPVPKYFGLGIGRSHGSIAIKPNHIVR